MSVKVTEKLNTKDTFFINKALEIGVNVSNKVAYVRTNRDELSRLTNVSTKTITRKLKKFGDIGLVSVEHKTGINGGVIIKLNPDKFYFSNMESMLVNPTKSDIKLVNSVFNKYNRSKGLRRTKSEMQEYNELKKTFNNKVKSYNEKLINNYISMKPIDWSFFSETDSSEEYFKIWLLSRAYDSFVKAYEKLYTDAYAKYNGSGFRYGFKNPRHPMYYRSLQGAFIESYNFKSFRKILEFSSDKNINPIVAMGKVFERYAYTHFTFNRNPKVPVPNQIIDKNGKNAIEQAIINQRMTNRFRHGLTTDFLNSPEIMSVYNTYNDYTRGFNPSPIDERIATNFGKNSLYHYYNLMMKNVESELEDNELELLNFYIREQLGIMLDNQSVELLQSEVGALTLRETVPKLLSIAAEDTSIDVIGILQQHLGKHGSNYNKDMNGKWMSNAIWTELNSTNIARETRRVYYQSTGNWFSISEMQKILPKINKYLPTSKTGMLDRDKVMSDYWHYFYFVV